VTLEVNTLCPGCGGSLLEMHICPAEVRMNAGTAYPAWQYPKTFDSPGAGMGALQERVMELEAENERLKAELARLHAQDPLNR
jgi:hypothetical protein